MTESNFKEAIKGSIEVGKRADFTVFSQDLMEIPDDDILSTEILYTIVGGETKYKNEAFFAQKSGEKRVKPL